MTTAQPKKGTKYFNTTKRGEINELREELETGKEDRQKSAVKKIIAAMTVGKDVSSLFPNVVKCMASTDLELKKLVYLYIMNYAKSEPDLAILAVNSFVLDSQSPSPLIRALAVRTMGCIHVPRITEYLCQPLHRCLKDPDPYVRKTAAICVAKLYEISPELVETQGFLEALYDLLSDGKPMVVANAVAALSEIDAAAPASVFDIDAKILSKLLAGLNECAEWGQVFILDALCTYAPRSPREAEQVCERVTPRLQHANSAVVLGAVKLLIKYMDFIQQPDFIQQLTNKMAPPLVTLLSKEPEIQYVALRNINLIVQKRPQILQDNIGVFFCKYNDPIYVKMEKLELIIMLAAENNIDQVLLELKDYSTEADVEFVRKAVRAIGRCAIKLDQAADRCVRVLLDLIKTKFSYVVQEAIIVMKDIFRKYPDRYESVIEALCEALDDAIEEPESKAAMLWIIGEYAERIDNANDLIENYLDTFHDEPVEVQLQLLTATVKLFLKKPKQAKRMVQDALKMATEESDNPDLRDRGFIYWRLLSADPKAARTIVLARKPLISDDTLQLESALLDELLNNIGTLASVYHKPSDTFVHSKLRRQNRQRVPRSPAAAAAAAPASSSQPPDAHTSGSLLDVDQDPVPVSLSTVLSSPPIARSSAGSDLLGLGGGDLIGATPAAPSPTAAPAAPSPTAAAGVVQSQRRGLLSAQAGKGMQLIGAWTRQNGQVFFLMNVQNKGVEPIVGPEIQFNKNPWGLTQGVVGPLPIPPIEAGGQANYALPVRFGGPTTDPGTPLSLNLQMAIGNSTAGGQKQVFFFQDSLPFFALLSEDGQLQKREFLELWSQISPAEELKKDIDSVKYPAEALPAHLAARNVFFIAKSSASGRVALYYSSKCMGHALLLELTFSPAVPTTVQCSLKTKQIALAPLFFQFLTETLQS